MTNIASNFQIVLALRDTRWRLDRHLKHLVVFLRENTMLEWSGIIEIFDNHFHRNMRWKHEYRWM